MSVATPRLQKPKNQDMFENRLNTKDLLVNHSVFIEDLYKGETIQTEFWKIKRLLIFKKMRTFICLQILISVIFAFSCNGQAVNDNCRIIPIPESSFNNSKNKVENALIDTLQIIEKQDSKIVFPLENYKTLELQDSNKSNSDVINYKSIGYIESFNSYIVEVTYLTSTENWLINKSDGEIIKLFRFFFPSPIDSLIVTFDLPENDEFNWIKVLKKRKDGFETLCDIHYEKWYPIDIYWNSKNEFIIKAISLKSSISDNEYYKVMIKD